MVDQQAEGGSSLPAETPAVGFFVVGDIGEVGEKRRAVAAAMAGLLRDGAVSSSFVLATGDNFYGCRRRARFEEQFERLREEMLELLPLPWYFAMGNHDVKGPGVGMHTKEFHGQKAEGGWEFRCPKSYFRLGTDWDSRASAPPWDPGLLDILVLNTNKKKTLLNILGVARGRLHGERLSWNGQKRWLQGQLSESSAAWKVVVGHHPIEFVPLDYLEHGLPLVRFVTTSFMKGHSLTRNRGSGLRDVILRSGADLYVCGHQHLSAHLIRQPSPVDYVIVGASSKLEQDDDDFENQLVSMTDYLGSEALMPAEPGRPAWSSLARIFGSLLAGARAVGLSQPAARGGDGAADPGRDVPDLPSPPPSRPPPPLPPIFDATEGVKNFPLSSSGAAAGSLGPPAGAAEGAKSFPASSGSAAASLGPPVGPAEGAKSFPASSGSAAASLSPGAGGAEGAKSFPASSGSAAASGPAAGAAEGAKSFPASSGSPAGSLGPPAGAAEGSRLQLELFCGDARSVEGALSGAAAVDPQPVRQASGRASSRDSSPAVSASHARSGAAADLHHLPSAARRVNSRNSRASSPAVSVDHTPSGRAGDPRHFPRARRVNSRNSRSSRSSSPARSRAVGDPRNYLQVRRVNSRSSSAGSRTATSPTTGSPRPTVASTTGSPRPSPTSSLARIDRVMSLASSRSWRDRKIGEMVKDGRCVWFNGKDVGFAHISATPSELVVRFYIVRSTERLDSAPVAELAHSFRRQKPRRA